MVDSPNVSKLGRELGLTTDGTGAKRWQDAKQRCATNRGKEPCEWVYSNPAKKRKDMKK